MVNIDPKIKRHTHTHMWLQFPLATFHYRRILESSPPSLLVNLRSRSETHFCSPPSLWNSAAMSCGAASGTSPSSRKAVITSGATQHSSVQASVGGKSNPTVHSWPFRTTHKSIKYVLLDVGRQALTFWQNYTWRPFSPGKTNVCQLVFSQMIWPQTAKEKRSIDHLFPLLYHLDALKV